MNSIKRCTYIVCILAAVLAGFTFYGNKPLWPEETTGLMRYYELKRLYFKWNHGLFGGRKFHERILKKYCYSLIGREFRTDYDYYLYTPEGIDGLKVECRFDQCRWLKIMGDIDRNSIKDVLEKEPELLKTWWRSTILLAVSGTVKKYRLSRDPLGDTIELYFESITLIPQNR